MSEFFLELFSEEIPAGLQKGFREKILDDLRNLFDEKSIKSKNPEIGQFQKSKIQTARNPEN